MPEPREPLRHPIRPRKEKKPLPNPYESVFYDIELYRFAPSNRFACDIQLKIPEPQAPESATDAALQMKEFAKELSKKIQSDAQWRGTTGSKYEIKEPSISDDGRGNHLVNISIISKNIDDCSDHAAATKHAVRLLKMLSHQTKLSLAKLLPHVQEHRPLDTYERDTVSRKDLAKVLPDITKESHSRST